MFSTVTTVTPTHAWKDVPNPNKEEKKTKENDAKYVESRMRESFLCSFLTFSVCVYEYVCNVYSLSAEKVGIHRCFTFFRWLMLSSHGT